MVCVVVEEALEVVVVGRDSVVVDARRRIVGVRAGPAEDERLRWTLEVSLWRGKRHTRSLASSLSTTSYLKAWPVACCEYHTTLGTSFWKRTITCSLRLLNAINIEVREIPIADMIVWQA